jgi:hypothetical protein
VLAVTAAAPASDTDQENIRSGEYTLLETWMGYINSLFEYKCPNRPNTKAGADLSQVSKLLCTQSFCVTGQMEFIASSDI